MASNSIRLENSMRKKILVPTSEFRESIVGNSQGLLLRIIEMIETDHRDAFEAEELCRRQAAVARDQLSVQRRR